MHRTATTLLRLGTRFAPAPWWMILGILSACSSAPEPANRPELRPNPSNPPASTGGSFAAAGQVNGGGPVLSPGPQGGRPAAPPISIPVGGMGGQGGTGGAVTCGSVQVEADVEVTETVIETPGSVLFVFDQSTSMQEPWNGATKLVTAQAAVQNTFSKLADKLSAGLILFPTHAVTTMCDPADLLCLLGQLNLCPEVQPIQTSPQISIRTGPEFLTAWAQSITAAATAPPGTPTEKAMQQAEAALQTPPPGNTVLVLVTDGEPTCGNTEAQIARRLLTKQIKTFVVGLPGASGSRALDQVAIAGGTAPANCTSNCYLTPTDAAALEKSLAEVATTIVDRQTKVSIDSCSFAIAPTEDADPKDVHLIVTETATGQQYEVPRDATNGWSLSADLTMATLNGPICDAAKAGQFINLSFQIGCVTVPPLPPR
jgi:hypothetical protein